ncbi:DUF4879 domain-containing protein [Lysinibacillus pakistanensis]|uniref:DUF4879 domain-containing protein n=1 Tax=Lysinibacillus pakistanensis TaxID=759811 RepID=A0AAX3WS16_9BACI|nr:DUF4879 domain-containing protein [Lysinibacillus pakistanensis]MDM5234149.1 DUF4879 domain-containing protein [Lysinibacillus pakistanensis]WHY44746.1 DUF4879 domain-containing protein [Lysinibacillus pakistanensis]WHY49753.1 DUF4879 domain-containing protein [Lysinibacillus pakistanensis]
MKKYLLAVGILTSGFLGLNTAEASEVEKDKLEVDPLIENLKTEHPDWTITLVTSDEATKIKEEVKNSPVLRGPAPPLTALYIDQIASQVGTSSEYTEDLRTQTSHAVSGKVSIGVMQVGYGSENQWLDDERITYQNRDYKINVASIDSNNDRIVDGFYYTVTFNSDLKISSGTSALYKFNCTSSSYPWNTIERTLNIPHL